MCEADCGYPGLSGEGYPPPPHLLLSCWVTCQKSSDILVEVLHTGTPNPTDIGLKELMPDY